MPELDAERRERLADLAAEAFDEWMHRMHGITSSCRHEAEGAGIADALAPLIAGWLAEAWDAGYSYAADDDPRALKANPYRAGEPT